MLRGHAMAGNRCGKAWLRWALLGSCLAGLHPAVAQEAFRTESYAAAAAARGELAFARLCTTCHSPDLSAGPFGPALKGPAFDAHWQGKPADALASYLVTRMPPTAPGSLSQDEYADFTAFLLRANGATPGKADRPAQALAPLPAERAWRLPPPADPIARAVMEARQARLDAIAPITSAQLESPPDGDWLMWRRTYGAEGFSPLRQVNRGNVAKLREAWSWNLPISQNQMTPLVHDGVMYVQSGNAVQALDGATGERLWQYIRPLARVYDGGRMGHVRTLALAGNKLYVPTADKHLIALDIRTGNLLWDQEIIPPSDLERSGQPDYAGLTLDGGPIVARGKVVIGVSMGFQAAGGCFLVALDAETGKEAWRFDTIARPGQPGGESWNGAPVHQRFGGGVWTSGSYDPARRLLFFGVGNTYNAGTLLQLHELKPGESADALYTDSTLALDPDTGRLAWYYQHMNRDVWDLDWAFERTLSTLPIEGKPRDVVITAGKLGIFDVLDRDTGHYLFSKDIGFQNLVTAIDPVTGRKTTDPALGPEPGKVRVVCPGVTGVRAWPATAMDPGNQVVFVPAIESCMDYQFTLRSAAEIAAGGADIQFPYIAPLHGDGKIGRIEAINLRTRKVEWSVRQRAATSSSALATGGGLVFVGSADRTFKAYDSRTGKVLWTAPLNSSPNSTPISYSVRGVQYVAIVTGGGGAWDSDGHGLVQEIPAAGPGVTIVAYRLGQPSKHRTN